MTDTKAPERVWILRDVRGGIHVFDERGDAPEDTRDDVEYVRADLLKAVAAERDRLAALLEEARGALICARDLIDVPVARRKLNLPPDDERIARIRAALIRVTLAKMEKEKTDV